MQCRQYGPSRMFQHVLTLDPTTEHHQPISMRINGRTFPEAQRESENSDRVAQDLENMKGAVSTPLCFPAL